VLAEGTLSIRLSVARGAVEDVAITSTRPVHAADALSRRSPADVQRLVPLLFPVCGVAHGVAFARAIERALGREPPPRLDAARDVACLAEAAVSHVWQLAIGWPGAAGAPSDPARVRQARRVAEQLYLALFGAPGLGAELLANPSWKDVRVAAQCLTTLVRELAAEEDGLPGVVSRAERASFGRIEIPAVAPLDSTEVGGLLSADPAFAAHAAIQGRPVDVSAYARRRASESVRAAEARHGRGLLARLVARRADALADVALLDASVAELARTPSHGPESGPSRGEGVGCATTARGPIHYWVRADERSVALVRSVAPTDWTFHPAGVLRDALVGAPSSPTLGRDAGWLVLALDPCVPWSVEVQDA